MLQFNVLASGSKGNSILVKVDGVSFLLDAGLTYKQLVSRLDIFSINPDDISCVFATHLHSDHVKAIQMIKKKHQSVKCLLPGCDYKHGKPIQVPGSTATITPVLLDHDEEGHGCIVEDSIGNKLAYITDTGTIPCSSLKYLIDCHAIIIETNFDTTKLLAGPYPDDLKLRVADNHLENSQSRELIELIAWKGLRFVVAHHLSDKNNDPELARFELDQARKSNDSFKFEIVVAGQNEATKMMTLI